MECICSGVELGQLEGGAKGIWGRRNFTKMAAVAVQQAAERDLATAEGAPSWRHLGNMGAPAAGDLRVSSPSSEPPHLPDCRGRNPAFRSSPGLGD